MQANIKQRYSITFYVKLKQTKKDEYEMLKEAFGDEMMSTAAFYSWFKRLYDGREHMEDEPSLWSSKMRSNGEKHLGGATVRYGRLLINCGDDI